MVYGCENEMILDLDNVENNNHIPTGPICTTVKDHPVFPNFCSFATYRCVSGAYFEMRVPCPDDLLLLKSPPILSGILNAVHSKHLISSEKMAPSEGQANEHDISNGLHPRVAGLNWQGIKTSSPPMVNTNGTASQLLDFESSTLENLHPYSTTLANPDVVNESRKHFIAGHDDWSGLLKMQPGAQQTNPDDFLLPSEHPPPNLQGTLPLNYLNEEAAEAEAAAVDTPPITEEEEEPLDLTSNPNNAPSLTTLAPVIPDPMKGDLVDLIQRMNQSDISTLQDEITKAANEGRTYDVTKLSKQLYQVLSKNNGNRKSGNEKQEK
ncbi:uncharacterized protein LOC120538152 [Polypterus senegalus]|uniref:uncharacterized protein LOC120538152 n=1 Tax=Polypterus senegalus TaxID=55291 RepID=UPI001962DF7A|nr:uncharacterized protein LOC120538152 [Polypterus senegalus]